MLTPRESWKSVLKSLYVLFSLLNIESPIQSASPYTLIPGQDRRDDRSTFPFMETIIALNTSIPVGVVSLIFASSSFFPYSYDVL